MMVIHSVMGMKGIVIYILEGMYIYTWYELKGGHVLILNGLLFSFVLYSLSSFSLVVVCCALLTFVFTQFISHVGQWFYFGCWSSASTADDWNGTMIRLDERRYG